MAARIESKAMPASEKKTEEIFIAETNSTHPTIVLLDASGSTGTLFGANVTVFRQLLLALKSINKSSNYRLIAFNSNTHSPDSVTGKFFKDGYYLVPSVIKRDGTKILEAQIESQINGVCLTMPHIAFENIPKEWFNKSGPTTIYLLTDGVMYGADVQSVSQLKASLALAINNIINAYPDVHLNIITVEPNNKDYTLSESLKGAAGTDVYQTIIENNLTGVVDKFVSVTLNNHAGFYHINKIRAPSGHLPFGDLYFSELHIGKFVTYIHNTIREYMADVKDDSSTEVKNMVENKLIALVQKLAVTIARLAKNKPPFVIADNLRMFCNMFEDSLIDPTSVSIILRKAVEDETVGRAQVFAAFRSQLKELFKLANTELTKNVKFAIDASSRVMTVPFGNKIVTINSRMANQTIRANRNVYPMGAVMINNLVLPIFPINTTGKHVSLLSDQCLRQWIRAVIGSIYKIDVLSDAIIYLTMALNLVVFLSPLDPSVKEGYRSLVQTVLRKKRLNVDITEMNWLLSGEIPVANSGRVDEFYHLLDRAKKTANINSTHRPMTFWLMMCAAVGNPKLTEKQYIHCRDSIALDCKDFDINNIHQSVINMINAMVSGTNYQPFVQHNVPDLMTLDYSHCPITLDDVSSVGGYRILPHKSLSGQSCDLIYVLSEDGFKTLTNDPDRSLCPICYNTLTMDLFEKVGPKPEYKDIVFAPEFVADNNIFAATSHATPAMPSTPVEHKGDAKSSVVIALRGTVGAGKSTFTAYLSGALQDLGYDVGIANTDQYNKFGMDRSAISKVTSDIANIINSANPKRALIIDTCGERMNVNNIFGHNLSTWKVINFSPNFNPSDPNGYMAWSLHNVLTRAAPDEKSSYCLCPSGASIKVCVDVHAKKAMGMKGTKSPATGMSYDNTLVGKLRDKAKKYANTLKPVDVVVAKFIADNF